MPPSSQTSITTSIDDRMIAAMRLVLAASALLITYMDPLEPSRLVAVTYAALLLYTAYSGALYALALHRTSFIPAEITHWVDVGCYVALIGLSSGTNSMFFYFFFFSILVASFRWGLASGLRVTLASAALFTGVGLVTAPAEPEFELNRFLLRPIYLLVLGYMMAYWGGSEIALKRRLTLLKDVSRLSNPRFGVDRTLGMIMEQLRGFYDADACLLIMADKATGGHSLRRADRRNPEAAVRAELITEGLTGLLLALPPEQALVYRREPRFWRWWDPETRVRAYDVTTGERMAGLAQVGGALGAESFITVPFRYHSETMGRLYLTASRHRAFDTADVEFLLQVLEHTMPTIDNIRLVDQLASDAAEMERQRIARDLHDSVIQPYIGLQIGLAAVRQKLATHTTDVRGDIERLIELTGMGVADLRRYLQGLREGGAFEENLLEAVRRFSGKFAEVTGIAVHVEAEGDLHVNDRLAAEVFQMVAEGLSNVRRHTSSTLAIIGLARSDAHLTLRIANDVGEELPPTPFTPRSLTGRAAALGGQARVEWPPDGSTVVVIEIPL